MNDMRSVIEPKSDQLNADDLLAGPITITITKVEIRPKTDQPVSVFFEGDNGKPYKCCKSMARVMVHCWGPDANAYIGKSMTLYCDPKVTWGGMAVGGIRISHISHIDTPLTLALTASKGNKRPFIVKPLVKDDAQPPHPLDESDPDEWMRNLGKLLRRSITEPEVVEIAGHSSVGTALKTAPPKIKKNINDMLADAYNRVRQAALGEHGDGDDGSSASEDPIDALADDGKFPA